MKELTISEILEAQAVRACIECLRSKAYYKTHINAGILTPIFNEVIDDKHEPIHLALFLIDLDNGKHKKWNLYKQEFSKIATEPQRYIPQKPSNPKGLMKAELGKSYLKEKNGIGFVPILNLTKFKPLDQIKKILQSSCDEQVKSDLLTAISL